MPLSPATIAEIKDKLYIEEVIGDFVPLQKKGSGQNLWACCPFPGHNEKTPSFSVHASKGFYKCFGCGEGGDAISFLEKTQGMSYLEAMEYLANKYGIPWTWTQENPDAEVAQLAKEGLYVLMQLAQTFYQENLAASPAIQAYLKSRGITEQQQQAFHLGYSPDAWRAFYTLAKKKGYDTKQLEASGLVMVKGDTIYDRFRDRILFSIHDTLGRVVGFGGRACKEAEVKYLNSPETPIYQKSRLLYGLYQAKEAIRKQDCCYLVEGYTDVLALHHAGIPNVVASAGTSLTPEQVRLLKRFTTHVILLFDGDEAGLKATLRGIDLTLQEGLDVRIVRLPHNEDPASYAQKVGKEAFLHYLKHHAKDFVTFHVHTFLPDQESDPAKKTSVAQRLMETLARIPDPIKKAVYLDLASKLMGLEKAVLETALAKVAREPQAAPTSAPQPAKDNAQHRAEAAILYYILHYGNQEIENSVTLASFAFHELEDIELTHPAYKSLYDILLAQWKKAGKTSVEAVLHNASEPIRKAAIDIMAAYPHAMSPRWLERYVVAQESTRLHHIVCKNILRLKLTVIRDLLAQAYEQLRTLTEPQAVDEHLIVYAALKDVEREITKALGIVIME